MIDTGSHITIASVISEGAAFAIDHNEPTTAVELLDQGRAMMVSQLSRYRTALDDLSESTEPAAKTLVERFMSLGKAMSVVITAY